MVGTLALQAAASRAPSVRRRARRQPAEGEARNQGHGQRQDRRAGRHLHSSKGDGNDDSGDHAMYTGKRGPDFKPKAAK